MISNAFIAIWRNLARFLVCGLILGGIPSIIYAYGMASFSADRGASIYEEIGAGWMLILFTGAALKGLVVHDCFATLNGATSTWRESLTASVRHLLPILAIDLLFSLGVGAGFVLLVIPGVTLMLSWCVAYASQVVEGIGVLEAFSRSARLTRGRRGAIFGVFILVGIFQWIVRVAVAALKAAFIAPFKVSPVVARTIDTPIVMIFTSILSAAIAAALYLELRRSREGVGSESTAAIFD